MATMYLWGTPLQLSATIRVAQTLPLEDLKLGISLYYRQGGILSLLVKGLKWHKQHPNFCDPSVTGFGIFYG